MACFRSDEKSKLTSIVHHRLADHLLALKIPQICEGGNRFSLGFIIEITWLLEDSGEDMVNHLLLDGAASAGL